MGTEVPVLLRFLGEKELVDPGESGRRGSQAGNHARGPWASEVCLPIFLPN